MTHPDKTTGVPVAFGLCAQNMNFCVCLSHFLDFIYPVYPWKGPASTHGDWWSRRTDGRREGRRERWMDGWMGWTGMEWTGMEWTGMHGMHETDVCNCLICLILNLPTANLEASWRPPPRCEGPAGIARPQPLHLFRSRKRCWHRLKYLPEAGKQWERRPALTDLTCDNPTGFFFDVPSAPPYSRPREAPGVSCAAATDTAAAAGPCDADDAGDVRCTANVHVGGRGFRERSWEEGSKFSESWQNMAKHAEMVDGPSDDGFIHAMGFSLAFLYFRRWIYDAKIWTTANAWEVTQAIFSCLAHIIGGLFRTRQPSTQGQSSQHPYRKRHVGKASEGWARGNGIYWHTYMVSCFVFLPQWYGSPGTTPGLSICKLFAAFLRSSLVFTN